MHRLLAASAFLTIFGLVALAQSPTSTEVPVSDWLISGPIELSLPAFTDTTGDPGEALLDAVTLDVAALRPADGDLLDAFFGRELKWKRQTASELSRPSAKSPGLAVAATYIQVSHSQKATLKIAGDAEAHYRVYLDGELLEGKPVRENGVSTYRFDQFLKRGKHRLLLMSAWIGSPGGSHTLRGWIDPAGNGDAESISISTDPRFAPTRFEDSALLDNVSSPTISADGRWIACVHSHYDSKINREAWIEIYDGRSSQLSHTLRPLKGPNIVQFMPQSGRLLYTTGGDDGTIVWLFDPEQGRTTRMAGEIKGLQKIVCAPDEKFLFFSTDKEKPERKADYELLDELEDRLSDWTNSRALHALSLETGAVQDLTATGDFAIDEFALSVEGDRILFTRRIPRLGRPYYTTEFWLYEIETGKTGLVLSQLIPFETRPLSFTWLPGDEKIAYVTAAFVGEKPDSVLRSFSETDLYVLDLKRKTTVNITGDGRFTVEDAGGRGALRWCSSDHSLWFKAVVGSQMKLMRTDPLASKPSFTEIPVSLPFVDDYDLSATGACVFTASGPTSPTTLHIRDGKPPREEKLLSPAEDVLPRLELATFDKWNFVNQDGLTIEGQLYFPADFDAKSSQKWPLVVYYYAGVGPRDERFTFTYHWWTANGYVVYVLNPVGCVGYGQEFADKHVNDWGTLATRDIIEGTRKLLTEKSYLDAGKVAAYGGSYGGFITMDLATKTDLFAALCSMSGISNITSYFGGGSWGFTYGDIAMTGSYPWNRRDIFVDKSPVFHADSIRTPLLLEHGTDDTNVPAIESDQMFVALKLLGRNVAYVRYHGEDHGFAKFANRVAEREIMLEWFDMNLKGEPEAWEHRWEK